MNNRLDTLKQQIRDHSLARRTRKNLSFDKANALALCKNLDEYAACAQIFSLYTQYEEPIVLDDAKFAFCHSFNYSLYPMIFNDEYDKLTNHGHPTTGSFMKNMSPDWDKFVSRGIKWYLEKISTFDDLQLSPNQIKFKYAAKTIFENICNLQKRYYKCALQKDNIQLANILKNVPYQKPSTFHEALQSILFMFNMLRLSQANHIGFHRIDQYLNELYMHDIASGILTYSKAVELVEEWCIMLNIDSDVYSAIQTGDSGMTIMLGGTSIDGNDESNQLTEVFLEASAHIAMLEPKVNLRVSSTTPKYIIEKAAQLTKKGLGYPQYCNDEQIVPGLLAFGYSKNLAYDYTVAACWEFVVRNGMDTPNALYLDMPLGVKNCIRYALSNNKPFKYILDSLRDEFKAQIKKQFPSRHIEKYVPNVLFSCLCGDCFEKLCSIFDNSSMHFFYGCHGVGASTAVNQLAAIEDIFYDKHMFSAQDIIDAIDNDFAGYDNIQNALLSCNDKLCTDSDICDRLLEHVFNSFANALDGLKLNGHRIRPGTGSAQYYAMLTQGDNPELRSTFDGRKVGEYISSSLAPAPKTKALGLLSTLQAFSHIDYKKICNGGPITVELTPDFFSKNNVSKFINYIQSFVRCGCQQLQINILDREKLIDAQKHPEDYKNLIVRVWGWSGYFIELDKKFQDQIIDRATYQ